MLEKGIKLLNTEQKSALLAQNELQASSERWILVNTMAYTQINPLTHTQTQIIIECEHISPYKSRLMTKALSKQRKCSDSKTNHNAWRTIANS